MQSTDPQILKIFGEIAGIGGLGLGVMLLVFQSIIAKEIFPTLPAAKAYKLLRLIVILAWSIAVIGIAVYAITSSRSSQETAVQVSLVCTNAMLPITVPTGSIAYVVPLNEEVNKHQPQPQMALQNFTGDMPISWPNHELIDPVLDVYRNSATHKGDEVSLATKSLRIYRCDLTNYGDTNVAELTVPLRVIFGVPERNERSYELDVTVEPLDKGEKVPFFLVNTCPVVTIVKFHTSGKAKLPGENRMRDFEFFLPEPWEGSLNVELFGSAENWAQMGCTESS